MEIGKVYKIKWLDNGFIQYKKLIDNLKDYELYYSFTTDLPIYKACVDKTYCLDILHRDSKCCFEIEVVN